MPFRSCQLPCFHPSLWRPLQKLGLRGWRTRRKPWRSWRRSERRHWAQGGRMVAGARTCRLRRICWSLLQWSRPPCE
ncbi:hypothetical protein PR202_gb05387 [Eleusine coracana subsp. coracana]|uniref:Uncharacterized protein n=1 Tax=Eleusine coracana subsp. coracana TaxID=191504 RepID=A0AAV5E6T9_ELECO|nr:hypothetical protein PR202_gb05387 [Eleusine coracana subsp. coracana]